MEAGGRASGPAGYPDGPGYPQQAGYQDQAGYQSQAGEQAQAGYQRPAGDPGQGEYPGQRAGHPGQAGYPPRGAYPAYGQYRERYPGQEGNPAQGAGSPGWPDYLSDAGYPGPQGHPGQAGHPGLDYYADRGGYGYPAVPGLGGYPGQQAGPGQGGYPWRGEYPPQAGYPGEGGYPAPAGQPGQGGYPAQGQSPPPQAGQPGPAGRPGPSRLRLVWVYPDLLSTYGDRGNLLILERRAGLRGIATESILVNADQPVPRQGDIYLLGGGEDLPQVLAARRLRADGGLGAAAAAGAVVFAVCAGYQLLGVQFGGADGEPVPGLEILNIRSSRGRQRGVGEILAEVDPALGIPRLTGFENHQGVTQTGPGVRPLARVITGVGNGDGTEGAYAGRVLGTYLHGPALVRNPALADLLLGWAAGPLPALAQADEAWALRLREQRLAAVAG